MKTSDSEYKELRNLVEQEINSAAVGADRESMSKNLGILISSIDLQKSIDRTMQAFNQYCNRKIVEALKEPNEMLRSAMEITKRKGKDTNWGAFQAYLAAELEREHKIMYPNELREE